MEYPRPEIGYYRAECCLLDLYRIDTQEDLEEANRRIEDNWEVGPLMVFATLDEAIAYLSEDGFSDEELTREYARLGWTKGSGIPTS